MLVAKMDFLTEQQTVGLAAGRQGSGLCASAARAAGLVRQTHRVGDVADEQRDGGEYLASRRRKSAPPALFPPRAGASCEQGRRAANEDAVALFPSLFSVVSAPVGNTQTTVRSEGPAACAFGLPPWAAARQLCASASRAPRQRTVPSAAGGVRLPHPAR